MVTACNKGLVDTLCTGALCSCSLCSLSWRCSLCFPLTVPKGSAATFPPLLSFSPTERAEREGLFLLLPSGGFSAAAAGAAAAGGGDAAGAAAGGSFGGGASLVTGGAEAMEVDLMAVTWGVELEDLFPEMKKKNVKK